MYNSCFKNLDTPEKAYWFGFIVGDGCIWINKNIWAYRFVLTLKDKEHVEKLIEFLGYSKSRISLDSKGLYQFSIGCKPLVMDLLNLGVTPKKSLTVDASVIPINYQWDFMRGLFDADGCIHIDYLNSTRAMDPYIAFFGNYPLLHGIYMSIENLINIKGRLTKHKNRVSDLYYTGRLRVQKVLDNMYYSLPYLDRKFKLYTILKEYDLCHIPKEHKTRKYTIYKKGISYDNSYCLYCGNKTLIPTSRFFGGENKGKFCSVSHAKLYYWKIKKEGNYAITRSYATG